MRSTQSASGPSKLVTNTPCPRRVFRRGWRVEALHDIAHDRKVELDHDAEEWLGWTGFRHPAEGRHLDADHQRLPCPVVIPPVTERRPLGALHDDTEGRPHDQMRRMLSHDPREGWPSRQWQSRMGFAARLACRYSV